MVSIVYEFIIEFVKLWLAMAPYILLGMLIAGILHTFLGENFIARHLGGGGFKPVLKATLFGIPLPICSCGVIPVAASLRKEGASKSSVLAFLVSTPTTGVDSVLATYSLMGPLFAIFRPLAAFVNGVGIGVVNRLLNPEKIREKPGSHVHASLKPSFQVKEILRYGFVELTEEIGKWLLIGVMIGSILTVAIPDGLLTRSITHPWLHFLILLVIAIPLYVCATGSIPIAAALIAKGFSPGAALVFLIAGPATNTVTLSFVYSKLGRRSFYLYLSFIILVSITMGWIFNLVWKGLGGELSLLAPHGQFLPPFVTMASGIVLLLLILQTMIHRKGHTYSMKYELCVPEMNCKHCKMTIENALHNIPEVDEVKVDLDSRMVGVNGEVSREKLEQAVREAGYAVKNQE